MKILVLLSQPQFWLGIGVVGSLWFFYRVYKKLGRRCRRKGCGSILKVKRVHKIYFADDESISPFAPKTRKLRWWIRRVVKLTFSECEKCKFKQLVSYDTRPVSLWHAWWVKIRDRQQYFPDPEFDQLFVQEIIRLRKSLLRSLDPQEHLDDTPPVLQELLRDLLDEPFEPSDKE